MSLLSMPASFAPRRHHKESGVPVEKSFRTALNGWLNDLLEGLSLVAMFAILAGGTLYLRTFLVFGH
jgi:hypothetical protein